MSYAVPTPRAAEHFAGENQQPTHHDGPSKFSRKGIDVGAVAQISPAEGGKLAGCFMLVLGCLPHGVKGFVPGTNGYHTWVPIVRWEHVELVGPCPFPTEYRRRENA